MINRKVNAILIIIVIIIIIILVICYLRNKSNECPALIMPPLDQQITIDMIDSRLGNIDSAYTQKIPKIIMQTNELSRVPVEMYNATVSILTDNREYSYYYYDNNTARIFIQQNYDIEVLQTYDKLIPGAYKADLFRYCYLYKMGGIYIDTGMISKIPFSKIIKSNDEFVSPEDNKQNRIYNAFMASVPNHPILKIAIDMVVENVRNNYYGNSALDITGPGLLGKAFRNFTNQRVQANKDYGNGIRIIRFTKTTDCAGPGDIDSEGKFFLKTKYPTYYIDRMWYNSNEHYSRLWEEKTIYN